MDTLLTYNALDEDAGKTVETVWKQKFHISAGLFTELKLSGKLTRNGEICRSIDTLSPGDIITADVSENETSANIVPTKLDFNIVYEDGFLLIADKPRKMSVHPSIGNYENTLANAIMYYWKEKDEFHRFHPVNRIDKDTSGICVVAKNRYAHGILSGQIRNGTFRRKYYAVLNGTLENKSGTIDLPIKRAEESVIKRTVAPDGKRAITHYNIIKENNGYSLADISLETGRTHQIRVHFSHLGYPLAGDWLYGTVANKSEEGHLLHAYSVEFVHPLTGEKTEINLPVPNDMLKYFM